ncbi:MAG: XRE family transcriptional regulator [Nocardioides sp.]|jgi:predicted transcriptional regulator
MGKTFDEILKERPGNPERRAAFKEQMLAEVRAYKLRELREMLALTQTDLADTLEISQKRVSEIERGQVDFTKVDTLRRYVDALGGTLRVSVQVGDETYQIA